MRRFSRVRLPAPFPGFWTVLAILALIAGVVLILDRFRISSTWVLADVASDAVVFEPDERLQLVNLATPRYGLNPDGSAFDGLRLDPPLRWARVLYDLDAGNSKGIDPEAWAVLLQVFDISKGCIVRLERLLGREVRLDVVQGPETRTGRPPRPPLDQPRQPQLLDERQRPSGASRDRVGACEVSVVLATKDSAAAFSSVEAPGALELQPPLPPKVDTLRRRVPPDDPVSLTFRSRFPLRLRSFPVVSLGFITTEGEQPRSATTGGVVQRRVYDDGSEGRRLHRGDLFTLGPVQGRLKELAIGSTGQEVAAVSAAGNLTKISTLFEGRRSPGCRGPGSSSLVAGVSASQ